MFSLRLSDRILTSVDFGRESFLQDFSEYEKTALRFCMEWLSGQESFMLHTSGSTGTPKPIVISRKHIQASVKMTQQALHLSENDTSLICLNTKYIAGIMMLARGMEIGMNMTLIEPDSLPLQHFSPHVHFDFLSFVPLQMQETLEKIPEKTSILNQAKAIILGGAAINEQLESSLQTIKAPLFHTYGMTETVSHIALRRLNGDGKTDFFTTLEGIKIRTDDRNCLVIASPTAENEVITNDLAELVNDNSFRLLGRIDNTINTGGVKVQAEKVEKAVGKFFEQENRKNRFFVGGLPDERLGETVTLFIEKSGSEKFTDKETSDFIENLQEKLLDSGLSKYELPRKMKFTDKFAETPTGKIERKKIIALFL